MTKRAVNRAWLTGLAILLGGALIAASGVGVMFANGGTWSQAPFAGDFHPTINAFFWGAVSMMAAGGFGFAIGSILQLIAWVGAMVNTARAPDKTWFVLLLILGLIGLQLPIMIAYVVAGPDVPKAPPRGIQLPPPLVPPQPPPLVSAA